MILTGLARLGADAEVRYTQGGDPVANLSLAWNYGRKDDQGKRQSQWISSSLWGDRAVSLQQYLTKGTRREKKTSHGRNCARDGMTHNALGEGRERGILREASLSTDGLEGKGIGDAG